ncbi:MAG: Inner membrane protein YjcH, clustering with ActP [uncultured Sphingomonadaceae bacterium]|uniref:Inner membrane protein YjcH, clustering with ActP n=1 Tax=uncultured Sphingomonadaceae bacterium TaxID=169976 RepID=A0A6J4TLH1_9SPHN|nr:MAG: Inner membrane protein YjcH, clustering with ActP [uncultured Sphingomonadaceae bacterium]
MTTDWSQIGDTAHSERLARVASDPRYHMLVKRRGRFTWTLTCVMLAIFFGYILLIAFNKALLARPIGDGATSIGIPIGLGVILAGIALTGIYVRRANREFDPLVRSLREDQD